MVGTVMTIGTVRAVTQKGQICEAFCELAAHNLLRYTEHKKRLTSAGAEEQKQSSLPSVTRLCSTKTPYPNVVVLEVWEKEQDANTKSRPGGLGI